MVVYHPVTNTHVLHASSGFYHKYSLLDVNIPCFEKDKPTELIGFLNYTRTEGNIMKESMLV